MIDRMDKVCEAIKREISLILQEEINDPRLRDLTITRVKVTRDLRHAKIYYLGHFDESKKAEIEKAFKRAASFIRSELAKRVSLKFIPRLVFVEDVAEKKEENIERTFEKIEEELGKKDTGEEGTENE